MLPPNGSSSLVVLLVLTGAISSIGCLVLKFCWLGSSAGLLVLLFASSVGSLVQLVR